MRRCAARRRGRGLPATARFPLSPPGLRSRLATALLGAATVGPTLCPVPALALPPLSGPPVEIAYIERRIERPPPLNNEDPVPDDEGLAGAKLGLKDSNASGRFVGVALDLTSRVVEPGADIRKAFKDMLAASGRKPTFVVVDAPADDLLALADLPEARGLLLLNIAAPDSRLRGSDCRGNVLHVAASRDMLTDALVQFLHFKRWTRILLVSGPHEGDKAYATALRRSAAKFGAKIVSETTYDAHGADIRDSALREFAVVTRGPEHDVVAVADEADEFGTEMVYNTDSPRPVVGTQGLTPAAWGRAVEAWAAVQLQNRFKKLVGRPMRPIDYAGWMAVHTVGEAAVQLKSVDPAAIRALALSPTFEIGGFKGRQLSYRPWDGQLREPIFDLWPDAIVATAPLDGFLHPVSDLDTLGTDAPDAACKMKRD